MEAVGAGTHVVWDLVSGASQPLFDPLAAVHEGVHQDGRQDGENQEEDDGHYDARLCQVLFWKKRRQEPSITTRTGQIVEICFSGSFKETLVTIKMSTERLYQMKR